MPWTRLDDNFHSNLKVQRAGPIAETLYVHSLVHCSKHLTDGFIDERDVRRMVRWEDSAELFNGGPLPDNEALAAELARVGLWEKVEGGWMVHDYLEYNYSKEQIEAKREQRVAAGRAGGRAKAKKGTKGPKTDGSSDSLATRQASAKQPASEMPSKIVAPYPITHEPDFSPSLSLSTDVCKGEGEGEGRERDRDSKGNDMEMLQLEQLEQECFSVYGALGGSQLAAMARVAPVSRVELNAALRTPGRSWGYAARVIESHRREAARGAAPPARKRVRSPFLEGIRLAMQGGTDDTDCRGTTDTGGVHCSDEQIACMLSEPGRG